MSTIEVIYIGTAVGISVLTLSFTLSAAFYYIKKKKSINGNASTTLKDCFFKYPRPTKYSSNNYDYKYIGGVDPVTGQFEINKVFSDNE